MSRAGPAERRVELIHLPYGSLEKPSMALGLLKAILAAEGIAAAVTYPNLAFAKRIGLGRYQSLARLYVELLGEWTFSGAAFPGFEGGNDEYLARVADAVLPGRPAEGERFRAALWEVRRAAERFTEELAQSIVARRPGLVGCSSMFQQHCAALALLRRVKELDPGVVTVIGGANCESEMGRATLLAFPWLDAVVSGEADELVAGLFCSLLDDGPDLPAERLPPGAYGRVHRLQPESAAVTHARIERLDRTPLPDFSDYFAALAAAGLGAAVRPGLLIETSRGCWWGESRHCTFCGLNGGNMGFRAKSAERALEELEEQGRRYGLRRFQAVDNILPMSYFRDLLPALARTAEPPEIFYEIKANLGRAHLEALAAAGVRWLQPGIESLHDRALEAMDKGTTAAINLRLLKWGRELGIAVYWNILHGIPAEEDGWYAQMADWVPRLVHLQPPQGVIRIRFERFSPYHFRAAEYGLRLRPSWPHRAVYPLSDALLRDLAYRFEDDGEAPVRTSLFERQAGTDGGGPGLGELRRQIAVWRRLAQAALPPLLTADEGEGVTRIFDTRPLAGAQRRELRGLLHRVHQACGEGRSVEGIVRALGGTGQPVAAGEVEGALAELAASGLVVDLLGTWLALALRGSVPSLPARDRFPGGYVDVLAAAEPATPAEAR